MRCAGDGCGVRGTDAVREAQQGAGATDAGDVGDMGDVGASGVAGLIDGGGLAIRIDRFD